MAHIWARGGEQVVHPEKSPTLLPEEFDERLRGLSKADAHRLDKIARVFAARCGLGPDDLFQEAVTRVLEGSRHCPRHVKLVRFLAGVMRSLSSDDNKAQGRQPSLLSLSVLKEEGFDPPDSGPTPEELCYSQQRDQNVWDELCVIFGDDELTLGIVEYILAGYEAEEIRKDFSLDQTAYDSKRRFIRRRIDSHLRQGSRS